MTVAFRDTNSPATEHDVAEFEREIGAALPAVYRTFLLQTNGGRPTPEGFDSFDIKTREQAGQEMVNFFLGLTDDEDTSLRGYATTYAGRLPTGFLPIAYDPGGNVICISLNKADYGRIYFWDHEDEVENGEVPNLRNVLFVAQSFDEFLTLLYEVKTDV